MKTFFLLLLVLATLVGCEHVQSPDSAVADPATSAIETETPTVSERVVKTDEQWKQLLTPDQYYVLREKGTELPFQNKFDKHFAAGSYACAACGQQLFESETKFDSGCGWPAFYAAKAGDRVKLTTDRSRGMSRVEVTCARCDSHLGHVFEDAPQTPTGQRFCINSVSLTFTPGEQAKQEEVDE